MIYSDCGVLPDPTSEQLVDIAIASADTARRLIGCEPVVAFLSFSTKGSASHPMVDKVVKAFEMTRERMPDLVCDGELQFDAAVIASVGKRKAPDSPVAGRANVLIFPNLESASISSRLIQHLARTNVYGDILLGIDRPAAELSRGATSHDILGVAAILGEQCNQYRKMFPGAGVRIPGE